MKFENKIGPILVTTTLVLGVVVVGTTTMILSLAGLYSGGLALPLIIGAALALFGTASLAAMLIVVNHSILKPIHHLSSAIKTISATNNLNLRIPAMAACEDIEGAVRAINEILDTTENAYLDMLKSRYEVESANKGKSLFIAKVSHELRTPIHSITGMLRILLKQETAPGKRQYIQMAQDSAVALLETINEILDFSKMQNGELALEHETFDLQETIRATVEHLIPRFEEKSGLAFCWDIHPDVPALVTGDAARMRNILVNLLGNAFKFADNGHVILEVSSFPCTMEHAVGVRFTVTDTGIGISTNKLATIFDPFTTADEGTARLYAGTGLGLAIVKQITERMGGEISVTSTPGVGSQFIVDIPLRLANQATTNTDSNSVPRSVAILAPSGPRQLTVAEGLRRFGCDVTLFSSDKPEQLEQLTMSASSFEAIHIIKGPDILNDELHPLLRAAAQHDISVVLSVPSSEITSTDQLTRSEHFFVTLQPTSALDIILITAGSLVPNTSVREIDEATEKATHKLNILIADDAKTNRIILKTLLEEAGHTVEVVENGKQLLERISFQPSLIENQPAPFDLVLTDIQMPVMDGITATQNFRELERQTNAGRKLPIVAVTSYAFPEECSKMLASGIDHILTKPINPKRLNRLISQITYDADSQNSSDGDGQSDRDIIEELCQLTDNVTQRLGELQAEVSRLDPGDSPVIVDIQGVFERSGDSLRRTGLILEGFLESYQEPLAIIESATLPPLDPASLRRTVHSLKGLLLDSGAQVAAELAASLEDKAAKEPQTITTNEIIDLVRATRSAATVIKEIVSALPSLEVYSALPSIEDALTLH
jgi:signal transduction histidine kinase/CheY-like chemotaxis protein